MSGGDENKNLFESMKKNLNLIETNQNKIKEIINKNNNEFNLFNIQIGNCQKSLEKVNEDITSIAKAQKKLKNDFDDELLKINNIDLNQSKLEKNEEERKKNLDESLAKALKEIELLKNKISENEKNLNGFVERIKVLEEEKRNREEEEDEEIEEEKLKKEEERKIKLRQKIGIIKPKCRLI